MHCWQWETKASVGTGVQCNEVQKSQQTNYYKHKMIQRQLASSINFAPIEIENMFKFVAL